MKLKYDGFRTLAIHEGEALRLLSRRGNNLISSFPEIERELRALPEAVIDGEVVMLDEQGRPQFERLRLRTVLRPDAIERAARQEPAAIFAFDLLALEGRDLRKLPLLKRKAALQKLLKGAKRICYTAHVGEEGNGSSMPPPSSGLKASLPSALIRSTRAGARMLGSRSRPTRAAL